MLWHSSEAVAYDGSTPHGHQFIPQLFYCQPSSLLMSPERQLKMAEVLEP